MLFRECMIKIVSPRNDLKSPESHLSTISDPILHRIALNTRRHVAEKVAELQHSIAKVLAMAWIGHAFYTTEYYLEAMKQASTKAYNQREAKMNLPKYFRFLQGSVAFRFSELFKLVLMNNLTIGIRGPEAGEAGCEDQFFCAEIDDEELPWDVNETDW